MNNITNVVGPCRRRGGRTSRWAMKKHKAQLMSIGKAKFASNSTTPPQALEPTLKESVAASLDANSNQATGLVTALHGTEQIFNEPEVLGPYEWLDSEIKRLEYIFHSEVLMEEDPKGSDDNKEPVVPLDGHAPEGENGGVLNFNSEERGATSGVMGPERVATPPTNDQERDSSGSTNIGSCNGESTGEWYNCCSPVNSRLAHEEEYWVDWDWTTGVCDGDNNNHLEFWDGEEEMLPNCLYGNNA
ncbi:hypothetical protein Tsubulata_032776 [Turnera subulata]|uniref:Uncharacterized protein n=1 Tax=Turnera subulata TaxID=218843 RepID=A0A9Q0GHE2_9ROSI|nr:hypothetical protein Tsubulata_032776 [Turnera subulata]